MGTFEKLYNNLKDLLDEVTEIQDRHMSPTFQFNGFPGAFIVPSGNESDFLTTNDNQRVYAFKIWIFTEYDQTNKETAYTSLVSAVDAVIDKIDKQENPDQDSRSMANELGAGVTLLAVLATPSRFALDEETKLLGAEVSVRCKTTVDLTLLT